MTSPIPEPRCRRLVVHTETLLIVETNQPVIYHLHDGVSKLKKLRKPSIPDICTDKPIFLYFHSRNFPMARCTISTWTSRNAYPSPKP